MCSTQAERHRTCLAQTSRLRRAEICAAQFPSGGVLAVGALSSRFAFVNKHMFAFLHISNASETLADAIAPY